LGLVAEEEGEAVGELGEALEAVGEGVVAVLGLDDLDIVGNHIFGHGEEVVAVAAQGVVHALGEEAAFQAGDAEQGLLGDGDALQGDHLLGVDGLVDGHEVGFEAADFLDVFQADDGEAGGGEIVFDGVLGGAGLAFGGARSGGPGGVGAVGSATFIRCHSDNLCFGGTTAGGWTPK